MDSKQDGTTVTPDTVRRRQEAKAEPARRPGGLAIGETYAYEDGLKIRVDRLGLLPQEPPQTIFDEDKQYVSAEAVRFEVTVTNEGEATASLSDLAVGVRAGKDGWPGDETWSGTRVLRGKLLPGASATGTYTYRVLTGTTGEVDVSVTRGHYRSDEKTQQVWTGAAEQGLFGEAEPGKGRLTQAQRDGLFAEGMRELDAMTGLDPVKRRVRIFAAQARMSAVRARHGLPASSAARHLVFSGPPGTGKAAVARLLGKVCGHGGAGEGATWSRRTGQTASASTSATPASRRTSSSTPPSTACCSSTRPMACTAATGGTPMRSATRRCRSCSNAPRTTATALW